MRIIFLWLRRCFLPLWRQNTDKNQGDKRHFYRRTLCVEYQKKKSMVKNFWIAAGVVVLIQPLLHVVLVVAMFTTFISFMYLDEC